MKIPTSFRLMAHTIRVRAIPAGDWKHPDCVGLYNADKQLIELRDQPGTQSGHIFAHEMVHAILTAMGHELNSNESFVDNFSGLLHQALETAKYPATPGGRAKKKKA